MLLVLGVQSNPHLGYSPITLSSILIQSHFYFLEWIWCVHPTKSLSSSVSAIQPEMAIHSSQVFQYLGVLPKEGTGWEHFVLIFSSNSWLREMAGLGDKER